MGLLSCALLERGFLVEVKDDLIYLTNNAYLRKGHFDDDWESSDLAVLWELLGMAIPEYTRTTSRYTDQDDWYGHRQDERRHLHTLIGADSHITQEEYDRLFAREHFRMESGHYLPYCGQESVALFKRRDTTRKIPILVLDAHTALLTKALSAVGCRTISACRPCRGWESQTTGDHPLRQPQRRLGASSAEVRTRRRAVSAGSAGHRPLAARNPGLAERW